MRLLFSLLLPALLSASDWPRFRGPNGAGISPDKGLPAELSADRNVVWKASTLKGNSSPIVFKNRVWITGHDGDQRVLLCFDARNGKELWRKSVTKARTEVGHPLNGPTTPSPVTDGRSVFAFYPEVGLLAYSLEGEERWRVPLGPFGAVQGLASSPVLAEGRVVLLIDTPEQAYLVAYDAKTGKQAWKADRPIGFLGSYATPSVYEPKSGGAQIVVAGAVELTGYDAKTGARVWWVTGVTNAPAVLPLVDGDAVFTTEPLAEGPSAFQQWLGQFDKNKNGAIEIAEAEGESVNAKIMTRIFRSLDQNGGNKDGAVTEDEYRQAFHPGEPAGGLVRTKLGGQGDVTKTHVGWRHKKGLPYVTAPVLYDGLLYVVRNGGILTVFRPETGEVVREERLKDAGGEYYAQPVAGDGKVYFANKDGKVTVIRAGEKWELLSSGDLTEQVIATPALADGRIYVRTAGTLYCFGKSGS